MSPLESNPSNDATLPEDQSPGTSKTQNEKHAGPGSSSTGNTETQKTQFPTPFKNALLWPQPKPTSTAKKNIKKKLVPTVATADEFLEYQRRLEEEKKEKAAQVELRKNERLRKALEKKNKNNKVAIPKNTQKKKMVEKQRASKSVDEDPELLQEPKQLQEPEQLQESEPVVEGKSLKTGEYVVVTYEGEKFPGMITKINKDGLMTTYDIKTMTMSGLEVMTGRVNWRWPEKEDVLTYELEEIVKKIKEPVNIHL